MVLVAPVTNCWGSHMRLISSLVSETLHKSHFWDLNFPHKIKTIKLCRTLTFSALRKKEKRKKGKEREMKEKRKRNER